jgi:hypothetical protein
MSKWLSQNKINTELNAKKLKTFLIEKTYI